MLIKGKLFGLKTTRSQKNLFSSILGTHPLDIISIESKWEKLPFFPMTSQNSSERHIWKTKHATDLSQMSNFFLIFLPIFRKNKIFR